MLWSVVVVCFDDDGLWRVIVKCSPNQTSWTSVGRAPHPFRRIVVHDRCLVWLSDLGWLRLRVSVLVHQVCLIVSDSGQLVCAFGSSPSVNVVGCDCASFCWTSVLVCSLRSSRWRDVYGYNNLYNVGVDGLLMARLSLLPASVGDGDVVWCRWAVDVGGLECLNRCE